MLNPRIWERKGEIACADAFGIDGGEIRGGERQAGSESERHCETDRDGAIVQTENQIECRWLWAESGKHRDRQKNSIAFRQDMKVWDVKDG